MPEPIKRSDVWQNATLYEQFVGRWSRRVTADFLNWLALPQGLSWLDVGCGSGAISQAILAGYSPRKVICLDRSPGFVASTRANTPDGRSRFLVADGLSLPLAGEAFDAAVSGFVLNFLPDPERALQEQLRVLRPGGWVAAYVWDYAGKMEFMRYFWEAACALDPAACEIDEGLRFPICAPEPLADLYKNAGLHSVAVRSIDIQTHFRDFDDYWSPFLGGQGPAPSYLMSLSESSRSALRAELHKRLPAAHDGSIPLTARAWAVRGSKE